MSVSHLKFKDSFWQRVCWGRPDSVQRNLCAMCHGALPEVPLQCWATDGAAFSLCDACVEEWVIKTKRPPIV